MSWDEIFCIKSICLLIWYWVLWKGQICLEIFHLQEKECMAILEDANIMGRINSLSKNLLCPILILCNAITKLIYMYTHIHVVYPHLVLLMYASTNYNCPPHQGCGEEGQLLAQLQSAGRRGRQRGRSGQWDWEITTTLKSCLLWGMRHPFWPLWQVQKMWIPMRRTLWLWLR